MSAATRQGEASQPGATLQEAVMEAKSLYASKTFWGAIVTGASTMAALFGVQVTGPEQTMIVEGVAALGAVAGVVLTIVGRVRANKSIK